MRADVDRWRVPGRSCVAGVLWSSSAVLSAAAQPPGGGVQWRALDPVAERVIAETMSPFCPGLTLANCTSPQAESLRVAVRARIAGGETPGAVQAALVATYGDAVRGAPAPTGVGLVAYVAPLLLLLVGALAIGRWLRRATARGAITAAVASRAGTEAAHSLPHDP